MNIAQRHSIKKGIGARSAPEKKKDFEISVVMDYGNFIIHHLYNTSSSDARHTINIELPYLNRSEIAHCPNKEEGVNKLNFRRKLDSPRGRDCDPLYDRPVPPVVLGR